MLSLSKVQILIPIDLSFRYLIVGERSSLKLSTYMKSGTEKWVQKENTSHEMERTHTELRFTASVKKV